MITPKGFKLLNERCTIADGQIVTDRISVKHVMDRKVYTKYDYVDQYGDLTLLVEGALGKEPYLYFVIIC